MKNVLITGAGSGIGRASAIALSLRGHKVYATTHTTEQARTLNQFAKKHKLPLRSFKLDLLSSIDRKKVMLLNIDVLINNAAIGDSGSVAEINVDRYRKTFEVNVFSHIELTQVVLKKMIKRGTGRIIFISSLAGRITIPFLSPYTSTKFAIEAIANSLRDEMKQLDIANIDVSIISPGAYHTGFNQRNISKQFEWMPYKSYFKHKVKSLYKKQFRYFNMVESKSLKSIVNQYIKAVEDIDLKDRYTAPCLQGNIIQLQRILGK